MSEEIGPYIEQYLGFALKRRREEAISFLSGLADSKKFSLLQMFHILAAAQQQVGSLWAKGTITVADEHYATEVTLEAIDLLPSKLKVFRRQKIGSALLANFVDGEFHTVGLKMFSQLLKAEGWDVELFTLPLHLATFFKFLETTGRRFDLICCSVTMDFNIDDLKSMLKVLRTNIHTKNMKILVGSQLFQQQRFAVQMIDDETKEPLADFLAKDFDLGIEFVRKIKLDRE
jgi:methanogenic corrinoid protein MtbC1